MQTFQRAHVAHLPPSIHQAKQLLDQGHTDVAQQMAEAVLRAEPTNVDAMILLAVMARARGDFKAIDRLVESAMQIRPDDRFLMAVRAENFFEMGESQRALEECDRALRLFPGDVTFIKTKALAHEARLEFEQALAALEPVLQSGSHGADISTLAGRILHGLNRFDEAIARLRPLAEDNSQPPQMRQRIWFLLVKTYDRMGAYDQAMEASAQAHALSTSRFDPEAFQAYADDLIAAFSASSLRTLVRSKMQTDLPVFVIGMPRSGTTLVEQIIHAHPQGFGAGELLDIENAAKMLPGATGSIYPYPHAAIDMTPAIADRMAFQYLSRLRAYDQAATRIVNKMLEQYQYVGLIWMLLPRARIIHIRRDPLDTCLSCYTRHLNPNRMPYVRNLEHLGMVYLQHERLMEHWKATLDLPIMTVQYEELVADQERISRQIIDFLGLPWDDRCLRYWESDRTVMTLSYDQVSKPIYDSSIGRWRHYEKHLEPLKRALGMVAQS
jgi:tetratricopeptide (TPR) repeat protein